MMTLENEAANPWILWLFTAIWTNCCFQISSQAQSPVSSAPGCSKDNSVYCV